MSKFKDVLRVIVANLKKVDKNLVTLDLTSATSDPFILTVREKIVKIFDSLKTMNLMRRVDKINMIAIKTNDLIFLKLAHRLNKLMIRLETIQLLKTAYFITLAAEGN